MIAKSASTVSSSEVALFSAHAADWWNEHGSFRPLHKLNPVRVEYVRSQICVAHGRDTDSMKSLEGLDILDVGCGGGLMCEPMARMGANVTGIDASSKAIEIARAHAKASVVPVNYRHGSAEDLVAAKKHYDVVTALEIAEHVSDLDVFIEALASLLKPNGLLILSTLNRTPKSFLLGIVAAEYLLRWVPRGTHQWNKFIRPSELARKVEAVDLQPVDLSGLIFNPLTGQFQISKSDFAVNYFLTVRK